MLLWDRVAPVDATDRAAVEKHLATKGKPDAEKQ
jgi:hypothetical protein